VCAYIHRGECSYMYKYLRPYRMTYVKKSNLPDTYAILREANKVVKNCHTEVKTTFIGANHQALY
jgi:hypothetical protein